MLKKEWCYIANRPVCFPLLKFSIKKLWDKFEYQGLWENLVRSKSFNQSPWNKKRTKHIFYFTPVRTFLIVVVAIINTKLNQNFYGRWIKKVWRVNKVTLNLSACVHFWIIMHAMFLIIFWCICASIQMQSKSYFWCFSWIAYFFMICCLIIHDPSNYARI